MTCRVKVFKDIALKNLAIDIKRCSVGKESKDTSLKISQYRSTNVYELAPKIIVRGRLNG